MPGPRSYWGGYVRFVSIVERSLGVALGELGAFVARRPNATLAFSLFAAFALSSGLTNIAASQESDSETLWCALVPSMYPTGCTWQTWNSLECTPLHPSPPSRRLRKKRARSHSSSAAYTDGTPRVARRAALAAARGKFASGAAIMCTAVSWPRGLQTQKQALQSHRRPKSYVSPYVWLVTVSFDAQRERLLLSDSYFCASKSPNWLRDQSKASPTLLLEYMYAHSA
jgi:hypothetical protein